MPLAVKVGRDLKKDGRNAGGNKETKKEPGIMENVFSFSPKC